MIYDYDLNRTFCRDVVQGGYDDFTELFAEKSKDQKFTPLVDKHVTHRFLCFVNIIRGVGAIVGDLAIAAFATTVSLATFGAFRNINKIASNHWNEIGKTVPLVYLFAINLFNAKARAEFDEITESVVFSFDNLILSKVENLHKSLVESDNFVLRELASRGVALLRIPVAVVARVADTVIGIFALIASIGTAGVWTKANTYAVTHLQTLKLIKDIHASVLTLINPHALM